MNITKMRDKTQQQNKHKYKNKMEREKNNNDDGGKKSDWDDVNKERKKAKHQRHRTRLMDFELNTNIKNNRIRRSLFLSKENMVRDMLMNRWTRHTEQKETNSDDTD